MKFLQGTYDHSLLILLQYVPICFVPFCFPWRNSPNRTHTASLLRFIDHTIRQTHTVIRTSLNEWYTSLTNTQTQQTKVHAFYWNRTHDPSNKAAVDARLRPQDHRYQEFIYTLNVIHWVLHSFIFYITVVTVHAFCFTINILKILHNFCLCVWYDFCNEQRLFI
jgi:hypothetical protein